MGGAIAWSSIAFNISRFVGPAIAGVIISTWGVSFAFFVNALTYIPGTGTELALNGRPMGVIEGADFAAAIFSLWLGENPYDKRFKNALLGLGG